jgi:hypothetical protein
MLEMKWIYTVAPGDPPGPETFGSMAAAASAARRLTAAGLRATVWRRDAGGGDWRRVRDFSCLHGMVGRQNRLKGAERREQVSTLVDRATLDAIDSDRRPGESRGDVLDRWAGERGAS